MLGTNKNQIDTTRINKNKAQGILLRTTQGKESYYTGCIEVGNHSQLSHHRYGYVTRFDFEAPLDSTFCHAVRQSQTFPWWQMHTAIQTTQIYWLSFAVGDERCGHKRSKLPKQNRIKGTWTFLLLLLLLLLGLGGEPNRPKQNTIKLRESAQEQNT